MNYIYYSLLLYKFITYVIYILFILYVHTYAVYFILKHIIIQFNNEQHNPQMKVFFSFIF